MVAIMSVSKNLSPVSREKYPYLFERIRAHLSMLKTVRRIDEKSSLLKSRIEKNARKARRNLKALAKRIVQRKIKHGKRLNSALDVSLKHLIRFLTVSRKKKKRRSTLSHYLQSLLELKESRFV